MPRGKKDEEEQGSVVEDLENDQGEDFDEEDAEDQVEAMTGDDIDLHITNDRIDVSVPRDGDPEKTLKAVGTLVKGLD